MRRFLVCLLIVLLSVGIGAKVKLFYHLDFIKVYTADIIPHKFGLEASLDKEGVQLGSNVYLVTHFDDFVPVKYGGAMWVGGELKGIGSKILLDYQIAEETTLKGYLEISYSF